MWFDENGMPTPYPPKPKPDPLLEMYDQQTAPPEPPPAAPAPAPAFTNKQMDLEDQFGIRTRGPKADQAAQNAMGYNAPSVDGQAMPQQFGMSEPDRQERPLTPQETAEAMPLEGLRPKSRDSVKDILYKATGIKPGPQGSSDGVENARTAQMEAKAAREQQAQINRASAREKSGDAWQKTLALNALQGAGPWAMGGGGGGMGSPGMGSPITGGGNGNISRVGGYTFVRGNWRPQDATEAAKTRSINVNTDLDLAKPALEREGIQSRERIAGANLEARTASDAADRDFAGKRLSESERHNKAMEENALKDDEARMKAKEQDELEDDAYEMEMIVQEMQGRQGIAEEQVKKNTPMFGTQWLRGGPPDKTPFLDDERDRKDPSKFVRDAGSYDFRKRRLAHLSKKLKEAKAAGKFTGDLPKEIESLLNQ